MQIQRIHLLNFPGIKGPVRLDRAPATLLYGPNSSGKSAVADSICLIAGMGTADISQDALIDAVHMRNPLARMAIGLGGGLAGRHTLSQVSNRSCDSLPEILATSKMP